MEGGTGGGMQTKNITGGFGAQLASGFGGLEHRQRLAGGNLLAIFNIQSCQQHFSLIRVEQRDDYRD